MIADFLCDVYTILTGATPSFFFHQFPSPAPTDDVLSPWERVTRDTAWLGKRAELALELGTAQQRSEL